MTDKADYFEGAVLDYFFNLGSAAPARPTQLKVALMTAAADTEVPTITEAAYAGYARVNASFAGTVTSAGGKQTANTNIVAFTAVAGAQQTFTHYGIFDQAGNCMVVKAITGGPIVCNVGDIPQFAIGALTHTET